MLRGTEGIEEREVDLMVGNLLGLLGEILFFLCIGCRFNSAGGLQWTLVDESMDYSGRLFALLGPAGSDYFDRGTTLPGSHHADDGCRCQ